VRDVGDGSEVVVVAPDPPNTIEHYDDFIARLAPYRRVVCFEPAGFGLSYPRRGFSFTLEDHADVIAGLLDRLALRRATLVMSCFAAYVALAVARRRPERVAR